MSPRTQTALVSLIVGILMLAVKGTAYLITHSSAVLSDALESVIHMAGIVMALYSVILSARPADESHPYGHGKVEFFSAGIEGALITVAAIAIIFEATRSIIFGKELQELNMGIGLTLFASVANLAVGLFIIRRGKQTSSITLIANGKHILTDSYTSFGVVAGLGLVVLTGIEVLDPLVAILVALNILYSGYKLVRTSIGGLMDEADHETLLNVVKIVGEERKAEWISLHYLRVLRSGEVNHIDFHLTIPFYWSVEQGHRFQQQVCDRMIERLADKARVLIHLDPCTPEYCHACRVNPCSERKAKFLRDLSWDVSALTGKPPVFDPDET
jgi:cation diffusion facilitator family transporter